MEFMSSGVVEFKSSRIVSSSVEEVYVKECG